MAGLVCRAESLAVLICFISVSEVLFYCCYSVSLTLSKCSQSSKNLCINIYRYRLVGYQDLFILSIGLKFFKIIFRD